MMSAQYIHIPTSLEVTVDTDEDGNFLASVPRLRGCVAGAQTIEETFADLDMAITAVLDVMKQDDPARHDEILGTSTRVQTDWALQSTLPGVPILSPAA